MSQVTYDALIVGGGLIGCLAAYHLARADARVLLIDQGEFNRQASGRNAGSLHFQLEHRLLQPAALSLEGIGRLVPLSLAAIADWRGLQKRLPADIGIRMQGGVMVGESQADLQMLEQKLAVEQQFGLPVKLVTGRDLHQLAPYLGAQINVATWCAEEGQANPRLLVPACINAAMACGARFLPQAKLIKLERDSCWQASILCADQQGHGNERRVEAIRVLNAAGAWAGDIAKLAGYAYPMQAVALQLNVTDRSRPSLPHLVQHVSQALSLKQASAGNFIIGGGWPARFRGDADQHLSHLRPHLVESNILGNLKVAATVVPQIASRCLLRSWTGVAGVTPDELPLLGEAPAGSGFYFAGGGSAFTLGPTLARLVAAEMLSGKSEMDTSLFNPVRFAGAGQGFAA
jgi:glycine/D-amino acid oxidase-like deaminating enzyme